MARRFFLPLLLPLSLTACGEGPAPADNGDAANAADPALTAALQDQIMVDPQLSRQANGDAVRPPTQPYSAGVPADDVAKNGAPADTGDLLHAPAAKPAPKGCSQCAAARESVTLGALAERQKGLGGKACAALTYSAGWAQKLPPDLPLHPQAHVSEAAGSDGGSCRIRVVSFSTTLPMQAMVDWYYTRAVRAGYSAEHLVDGQQHILGGTRDRDGGAYVLYLEPRKDGGTDMDLIANNGG